MKRLLIALALLVISCVPTNESQHVMTHADSINMYLAKYKRSETFDQDSTGSVNAVLARVLEEKRAMLHKFEILESKMTQVEYKVEAYAQNKANAEEKKALLAEIKTIQSELAKISTESKLLVTTNKPIKEVDVAFKKDTSFDDLPPGNYISRISKTEIISIRVTPAGDIFVSKPTLDSTTVLSGGKRIPLKVQRQLDQIKAKINN